MKKLILLSMLSMSVSAGQLDSLMQGAIRSAGFICNAPISYSQPTRSSFAVVCDGKHYLLVEMSDGSWKVVTAGR